MGLQHLVYIERVAKQIRREVAAKDKAAAEARSERIAAGDASQGDFAERLITLPNLYT